MAAAVVATPPDAPGLKVCRHCMKFFRRPHALSAHEKVCVIQQEKRDSNLKTKRLRPASEIAQDPAHSAASLQVGEGVTWKGQENKELFFPEKFEIMRPQIIDQEQGWARKGGGKKKITFTREQKDWLRAIFDHQGGTKIKEHDAHTRMKEKFNDSAPDAPYSYKLVLSAAQIKNWFSSEASRRRKLAAKVVVEQSATELEASRDLSRADMNEDAGTDQAEQPLDGPESRQLVSDKNKDPLLQGALFVVVKEDWEEEKGFEVWEMKVEDSHIQNGVLTPSSMFSHIQGRKWIHEASLMSSGQRKGPPDDLPDKSSSVTHLALAGQRRFAPRCGRREKFDLVKPVDHGHVWVQIREEQVEYFEDTLTHHQRLSFVFQNQEDLVRQAYDILTVEGDE